MRALEDLFRTSRTSYLGSYGVILLFVPPNELYPRKISFCKSGYRIKSWRGTLEASTSNLDLRPGRRGARKQYFLCSTAYTVPIRRGIGREGAYKLLIFGGPCRGRTYGPLIKREKEQFLIRLAIATVSPKLVAISFA